MKLIHKVLAWGIGIWLLLICVSGSLLLYKDTFLKWRYESLATLSIAGFGDSDSAHLSNKLSSSKKSHLYERDLNLTADFLRRIDADPTYRYTILGSPKTPWHLVVDHYGNEHYFDMSGAWVLTRPLKSDWISWLREFHMHLLLEDKGEDLLGIIAIATILLLFTGIKQWWPKRFSKRLFKLPLQFNKTKSFRQWHTVLGVITLPSLGLIVFTSIGLLYFSTFYVVLVNWLDGYQPIQAPTRQDMKIKPDWEATLASVSGAYPTATLRLVSLQQDSSATLTLRIKLASEWHPNGRSNVVVDKGANIIVQARTADQFGIGETLLNTLYPLHIGAVGGSLWLVILTFTGVAPILLFAFGYQLRRRNIRN